MVYIGFEDNDDLNSLVQRKQMETTHTRRKQTDTQRSNQIGTRQINNCASVAAALLPSIIERFYEFRGVIKKIHTHKNIVI